MSWLFDTIIKYYKNQYRYTIKTIYSHNFKFAGNIKGIGDTSRLYCCSKCKCFCIAVSHKETIINKIQIRPYIYITDQDFYPEFYNKTCNQIIMEKACL